MSYENVVELKIFHGAVVSALVSGISGRAFESRIGKIVSYENVCCQTQFVKKSYYLQSVLNFKVQC